MERARISLTSGPLEYVDTGGELPVVVLLHGLLMNDSLWTKVVEDLGTEFRCVVPVLPMGAHRLAVTDAAILSLRGLASLVAEFLDALQLRDVTLVGNDTGGAIVELLLADGAPGTVGAAVLVSCDAFDNVPPGLTGKTLVLIGHLPPRLFGLVMQQLRLRPIRRLPIAFGWLTKRGDRTCREWLDPVLHDQSIRRDTVQLLRSIWHDRHILNELAGGLQSHDRAALVVWATHDKVMPSEHGRRLASILGAVLVEVDDSATLIPLDQPAQLARVIQDFMKSR